MFILQNAPVSALKLPGLTINPLQVEQETTAFDITLSFVEMEQGQMHMSCRYNTDLFNPGTIVRLLRHMETLLHSVVTQPEARLNTLELLSEAEKQQQAVENMERKESKFNRLMTIKPKAVNLSQEDLITTDYLQPGQILPLVVQPGVDGLDLRAWGQSHQAFLEAQLCKHGAILFRDCNTKSIAQFEQFARIIAPELMEYGERSSPRTKLDGAVYTSTDHPADQYMLLHNEQSYTLNWPMRIWFFCVQPAQQGGRTPIADSRKIFNRLDPRIIEKFAQKQVMYVRNYGDGLGLPWQEVFQSHDRAVVEEHCRNASIAFEWKDNNRLRTRQVRPAIRRHPKTGETVWFNHALFFHVSSLEATTRESLLAGLQEDDLPFNTCYGDGSPFEDSVLEAIREAYRQETVSFPWQEGDILMLDNMLVAHGREPFVGPRKVVVAMAEPFNNSIKEK
jgi:alpha-ketoglutarate-dependent taurine dioxygenase